MSLSIMSQRENGFRVNSKAKGSINAARRAIRVQPRQGGPPRPGSITGVGSQPGSILRRGEPCFESHLLPYYKPRGCLSRQLVTHENYLAFLYCNWS